MNAALSLWHIFSNTLINVCVRLLFTQRLAVLWHRVSLRTVHTHREPLVKHLGPTHPQLQRAHQWLLLIDATPVDRTHFLLTRCTGRHKTKTSHCFLAAINSPRNRETMSVPLSTPRHSPLPPHNALILTWLMWHICDNSTGNIYPSATSALSCVTVMRRLFKAPSSRRIKAYVFSSVRRSQMWPIESHRKTCNMTVIKPEPDVKHSVMDQWFSVCTNSTEADTMPEHCQPLREQ